MFKVIRWAKFKLTNLNFKNINVLYKLSKLIPVPNISNSTTFKVFGVEENKIPSLKAKVNFPSHHAETHISIFVSYVCRWENHFNWSYFIISIQPLQTKFTFIYNTGCFNYIEDTLCILLIYFVEIKCIFYQMSFRKLSCPTFLRFPILILRVQT